MTGFPANYANSFQLETQIAVNLHRFKIGTTIQTTSASTNDLPLYDQLPEFQDQLEPLAKRLNIEVNRHTLEQIFDSYTQKESSLLLKNF